MPDGTPGPDDTIARAIAAAQEGRQWHRGRRILTPCTHATIFYDVAGDDGQGNPADEANPVPVWRCGTARNVNDGQVLDRRGMPSHCDEGKGHVVGTAVGPAGKAHPVHVPEGYELREGSWTVATRRTARGKRKPAPPIKGQLGLLGMPEPVIERGKGA
jgi:hypothetical protein